MPKKKNINIRGRERVASELIKMRLAIGNVEFVLNDYMKKGHPLVKQAGALKEIFNAFEDRCKSELDLPELRASIHKKKTIND